MDANIGDPRLLPSVERMFEGQSRPGYWGQVTLRAIVSAVVLGIVFCFVTLRIHMSAGIVPSMNIPATVLSYCLLKWQVAVMKALGVAVQPFNRHETAFVVAAVNSCVNVALTGGFATCGTAMSSIVAKTLTDNPDNVDIVDNVDIGRYFMFLLLIGIAAVFLVVPLKQIMLVDYKLLYPSGTVAALLVNTFHTPEGAYAAKLQVTSLLRASFASFAWAAFQWLYTGGSDCGFESFPTFGLYLYKKRFYFNFSPMYVGLGMICPHVVNFALFLGGTFSWGFLYPYIESKQGDWYDEKSTTSLRGANGYKVFIGVTIILTDGLFNFFTVLGTSLWDFYTKRKLQDQDSSVSGHTQYITKHPSLSYDDRKRLEMFFKNKIPHPIPVIGYIICVAISVVAIPSIYPQIKSYHVVVLFMIAPVFGFCNTYGLGLTDWTAGPTYAKFTIFMVAAWIGHPGAVVAGLVACGIMNASTHNSAQAMQDFKTGFLTLTSPVVILTGLLYGVVIGAIINPSIYWAFKATAKDKAPVGSPQSDFPCPYAGVYRAIGIIGMGGVKELPKYCLLLCMAAFLVTLSINVLKLTSQVKGWGMHESIPSMTAVALPFFAGPNVAIPMVVGSLVVYLWHRIDRQSAQLLAATVASGMISGEGLFALPTAVLSLNKVRPPICMKFISSGKEVAEVDAFLSGLSAKS